LMATAILTTKLFIPPPPPKAVLRPRLMNLLNEGLHRKLTLISAPAGFGKTTLVSTWVAGDSKKAGWLSLEEVDGDPTRFLTYLVAALRMVAPNTGEGVLASLQSAQPSPTAWLLPDLINEISTIHDHFLLVLDDYHTIESTAVDDALGYLLEHLPPQMHLVIATREDPQLPLARLRARDQLTEVRAADLRFTHSEAAGFLNRAMGLSLSAYDISALDSRTEGWIAGLQLAALSMRGHGNPEAVTGFIRTFTGNHRFVMDYLVEEVLEQLPGSVQAFLLRTSILDRLCGPLCDAVLRDPSTPGQETLEYLERANLFIVPLDDERRWYRYHHLFADLLRRRLLLRLPQRPPLPLHEKTTPSSGSGSDSVPELHRRASQWYEENGLELEAFHHAAAAGDVERAERLIEGNGLHGVPLYFRGASAPVLNWLESLSPTVLNTRPSLWVTYASALLLVGQNMAVEEKLQAAEAALGAHDRGQAAELDDKARHLIARIASMRATMAVVHHDVEAIIAQSQRALEHLEPNDLHLRIAAKWTLGYAYQLQGERAAAEQVYTDILSRSGSLGDSIYTIAAMVSLAQVQEAGNHLRLATTTYKRAIELAGNPPQPIASEAHLGLARIHYQWNDLGAAEEHAEKAVELMRRMDRVHSFASYSVLVSQLRLAHGDVPGAAAILEEAEEFVRQHNFAFRLPDVIAARVRTLLRLGSIAAAASLAQEYALPRSLARVCLAQGDPARALALLEPLRQEAAEKSWVDERLQVAALLALAYHMRSDKDRALQALAEALALAEPGGSIRVFVDEGPPMARLLYEALSGVIEPQPVEYISRVLAAFPVAPDAEPRPTREAQGRNRKAPLVEPLSEREVEVFQLIAEGLSNQDIAGRLYLSLHTVKVHARNIFAKIGARNRTEAVAKGRALGILPGP
jgi:LuxR family transcriptional regulator, maltose regulon positive regulatory protein